MCIRLVILITLATVGCGRARELRETPMPDLSRQDRSVQDQIRARHAALMAKADARGITDQELGTAYGELAMLLHAAEYYEAAEPAYQNARALLPQDVRWPYYLALVHTNAGDSAAAVTALERVLALRGDDVPALVRLGRIHLEQGEPAKADAMFARARAIQPRNPAVLAGLGQAALARKDYARAAALIEEALALDPSVAALRNPLAMAYRGLGDTAKAEVHLTQWRNTEIPLADPLRQALDVVLDSGLSYELRGVRALEARDFETAERLFRQGVALADPATPIGRSVRHKLGTALFLRGKVREAVEQFEIVTRAATYGAGGRAGPSGPAFVQDEAAARAHYSLGVIAASSGRGDQAIASFRAAVANNATYTEALVALGDALRRNGEPAAALKPYADAVAANPRAADARFGYAMALVRLRRYVEACDWLVESVRAQPDRPELAHALARLSAAAPDPRARDGRRALSLTQELFRSQPRTTALGATMAMTMAEIGEFAEAAAIQRDIIDAARRAGHEGEVRQLTANLRRYERGEPCRTPWPDDDPVHRPGPPVVPNLAEAGQPST